MKDKLVPKIKSFPKTPGVYQFCDKSGGVLYVGKAKNLFNRIKSYFLKEIGRGPAIDIMVSESFDIKYIETESEIEAVLLEADLIKKLKPKYNVRQKDDKSFLVVKITKSRHNVIPAKAGIQKTIRMDSGSQASVRNDDPELFPCVELVRFRNVDLKDKSAWYFGPYPAGELLKKSMNFLRKIFPFRDCSKTKFATYRRKGRPCIYGDIRVCTAPCVDWVNEIQYKKNIIYLKNFLRGQKKEIYQKLNKEMKLLSKSKRFEEAALVRNKIGALDHLKDVAIGLRDDVFNGEKIIFKRIECYDVSNITGLFGVGAMTVFTEGKKDTDQYRKFKIKFQKTANDLLMMKEMLIRRFHNNWEKPDLIVIDGGETHLKLAKETLAEMDIRIPIVSIAKGPDRKKDEFFYGDPNVAKLFMTHKNLRDLSISVRNEAHRFAISYYRSLHKKEMFK